MIQHNDGNRTVNDTKDLVCSVREREHEAYSAQMHISRVFQSPEKNDHLETLASAGSMSVTTSC